MSTQKLTVILLVSSLLLLSAGCIGEDLTAEQIAEEYKQKTANIEDYSATVYTTMYMGEQKMTTVTSIAQKLPDKMKVATLQAEQGEGTTIVSNGETMWTYYPNQNLVTSMKVESIENNYDPSQMDYANMIQNLMDKNDITFDGVDSIDGRSCYVIHMNPNDDTEFGFNVDIKAWIDKETQMMLKYEFYDEDGNLMMVSEYKDLEVNTGIPDSEFVFNIPEGAKVATFESFAEEMPLEEEQQVSESME